MTTCLLATASLDDEFGNAIAPGAGCRFGDGGSGQGHVVGVATGCEF